MSASGFAGKMNGEPGVRSTETSEPSAPTSNGVERGARAGNSVAFGGICTADGSLRAGFRFVVVRGNARAGAPWVLARGAGAFGADSGSAFARTDSSGRGTAITGEDAPDTGRGLRRLATSFANTGSLSGPRLLMPSRMPRRMNGLFASV